MNREIKFRAWNVNTKRMAEWEEVRDEYGFKYLLGNDVTIPMQFTGLKDKKEKDIYFGDIVKFTFKDSNDLERGTALIVETMNYGVGILRETEWKFGLSKAKAVSEGGGIMDLWEDDKLWKVEVIGNIYENPNLCDQD